MKDHTSSKTIHSNKSFVRETTTRVGSREKTAPPKSKSAYCFGPDKKPTNETSESRVSILPVKTTGDLPCSMTVNFNDVLRYFHIENLSNASEDESMFFFHLHFRLLASAKILNRESNGNTDRAYKAFRLAMQRVIVAQ